MRFEVGKCYEHTTGKKARIIAEVNTYFYGHGFLAETNTIEYLIFGVKEENTIGWCECPDFVTSESTPIAIQLENYRKLKENILKIVCSKKIDCAIENLSRITSMKDLSKAYNELSDKFVELSGTLIEIMGLVHKD